MQYHSHFVLQWQLNKTRPCDDTHPHSTSQGHWHLIIETLESYAIISTAGYLPCSGLSTNARVTEPIHPVPNKVPPQKIHNFNSYSWSEPGLRQKMCTSQPVIDSNYSLSWLSISRLLLSIPDCVQDCIPTPWKSCASNDIRVRPQHLILISHREAPEKYRIIDAHSCYGLGTPTPRRI